jgi:hypothetical protein
LNFDDRIIFVIYRTTLESRELIIVQLLSGDPKDKNGKAIDTKEKRNPLIINCDIKREKRKRKREER